MHHLSGSSSASAICWLYLPRPEPSFCDMGILVLNLIVEYIYIMGDAFKMDGGLATLPSETF